MIGVLNGFRYQVKINDSISFLNYVEKVWPNVSLKTKILYLRKLTGLDDLVNFVVVV